MLLFNLILICGCKSEQGADKALSDSSNEAQIIYASGFSLATLPNGVKMLSVHSPWPDSDTGFVYALVPKHVDPKEIPAPVDAVIPVPVKKIILTSTTHIPALEVLGVEDRLVGFPETRYISSEKTRKRINEGLVTELGSNELLNTEVAIELEPDLIIGFGIDSQNKAYKALENTGIPVVYNGDWTEPTPLGKAEWIKFFAPFFELESEADSIFSAIETDYLNSKRLAKSAQERPTVLSGALYKDIWYLPAGESWAAGFMEDANAEYLWKETKGTGSLSLSLESVLDVGSEADYWISPSQFSSYVEMNGANEHYSRFNAFREKRVHTFALTRGSTGGLLYYELGPGRPDIVLRDLIHIFHPELLPGHEPYFFKPLE
ncbi:MAG: ABC transporter substrate-binding protein [Flavobacteriaceae bacterium]